MIFFDLGHGGRYPDGDSGAAANGIEEAAIVTDIGIMAAVGTRALGHSVGLTRIENVALGETKRKQLVTSPVLSAVVSIHANASVNLEARGWEIFVSAHNADSKLLGNMIARSLLTFAPIPPRNPAVKVRIRRDERDFYYIINEPTQVGIPAVLVEVGFVSNVRDADVLRGFWGRFALSYHIARGVHTYMQLKEG